MRVSKKKFIYLISPNKIDNIFYKELANILKTRRISFFQLRLKDTSFSKRFLIGKKIKRICKKYGVKLIINDDVLLTKKLGADGCHLGQKDIKISLARKILKKKIIGITCHNSIKLTKQAIKNNADYLALGAFYVSKTKETTFKASLRILRHVKKITKTPVVAIGGINNRNYKKLLLNKANFLAISGYIWNNKKLSPIEAFKKLK